MYSLSVDHNIVFINVILFSRSGCRSKQTKRRRRINLNKYQEQKKSCSDSNDINLLFMLDL